MEKHKCGATAILKKLCVFLLMAAFIVGVAGTGVVSAAETEAAVRMNVMLVIDGSGSLTSKTIATDPKGLRYDAIDLFLALLTNDGNNVGAVVFSDASDSFRLYDDLTEVNGKSDKLALSEAIRGSGAGGGTNIGAAMLKAVEEASTMSQKNGLPSIVILFSDGRTDVDEEEAYQASLAAKEEATVLAQESGIPVYTICLNANDVADPQEMQEIAERTSGAFVAVDEAEDLSAAFEAFYSLIFASAGNEIQEASYPDDGKLTFTVPIPSYGAEEVNIILDTTDLVSKTIASPSNTLTDEQVEAYTMSGGYYDVIKLINPEQGEWTVELSGVPQESVTINVLYNIDSIVQLRTADGGSEYSAGDDVVFEVNLVRNGEVVSDSAVTDEYTAKLVLTNMADGTEQEVEMTSGSGGTFTYVMQATEYTSYSATAYLEYSNLELESNEIAVNFDNTPPVVSESYVEVEMTVTPFTGRSRSFNLSDYFTDAQDSQLTYSIVSSQLVKDTVDLNGQTGEMLVNTAACRSGDLVLQAADSQGAAAQMTIRFKITNLTLAISGSMIAVIVGIAAFLAVSAYAASNKPWRGMITVRNLSNGVSNTHGDFRGSLALKKFCIGNCGLDGKFVTPGKNRIEFVAKKPVFACRNGIMGKSSKRVSMTSGTTIICTDESQSMGISVEISVQLSSGFGGFGGSYGRSSSKKSKKNTKSNVGTNPFA